MRKLPRQHGATTVALKWLVDVITCRREEDDLQHRVPRWRETIVDPLTYKKHQDDLQYNLQLGECHNYQGALYCLWEAMSYTLTKCIENVYAHTSACVGRDVGCDGVIQLVAR